MKGIKIQWIMVVLLSVSLGIHAQTQIGNDIDGADQGQNFGHSTSISSDGTIVAASGFGGSNEDGRLRVFKNTGGVWTLYGTDNNGQNFGGMGGYCVSLSADGHTLAVGRWQNVVKVFSYDETTNLWTQKGSDITNNTGISAFGNSIDLSSDGNTIVIGISGIEQPPLPTPGITQVFTYEAGAWNQVGNNINGLMTPEHSGISVGISSDATIVAVSNDDSLRMYQNVSGTWTIMGDEILLVGNTSLKNAISLSSNGETIVIGEPYFTDTFVQQGRVRVFSYRAGNWDQVGSDIIGEVTSYRTGWSVSVSSDGQVIAIGELGTTSSATDTGRTRIFQNQASSWVQIGTDIFGEANEDYSGWSVSLSSDASTVVIGASLNDGNGTDSGHVRLYDLTSLLAINEFEQANISLFPNPVRDQFTIQLHEGMELKKVTVYNSLGQLAISNTSNIINTSKLSVGIYYVEINTNKGNVVKKIVVL